MTKDDLNELSRLDSAATPGPWYVGRFDDEHFMSAVSIKGYISDEQGRQQCEVVAATLIQQPDYIVPSDGRFSENAALIVRLRNDLPELLRWARIGIEATNDQPR